MLQTYSEALSYIHSLNRFGSVPGLERIRHLLERLGNPQKKLKFVHVAGTNGKGSTVAMTANILKTAGYKTGMYISPYVLEFRERIQINSKMIPEEKLLTITNKVKDICDELLKNGEIITEFEVVTAIAMCWFSEENCDIVCLEVGLGGRFDATNVIDAPLIGVITAISLDHTEILGDNVEQITREKCGILKPGSITVSYPLQEPDALAVIMETCSKNKSELVMGNMGSVEILSDCPFRTEILYDSLSLKISLAGKHQIANTVTVVEIVKQLRRLGYSISDTDIKQGIATTFFPARMEILSRHPLIVLDAAHNLAGACALSDMLEAMQDHSITIIIGMLQDKDYYGVLEKLSYHAAHIFTVTPQSPRAIPAKELAKIASPFCKDVRSFESYVDAIRCATTTDEENLLAVICGSLYLAGEMRRLVKDLFAASR